MFISRMFIGILPVLFSRRSQLRLQPQSVHYTVNQLFLGCPYQFLFSFRLLVGVLPTLFSRRSPPLL